VYSEPMPPTLSKLATTLRASSVVIFIEQSVYLVSNTHVNLVVLMGPEKDISVLGDQVRGTTWDGTGIGYGVRGSNRVDLTLRLQRKQTQRNSQCNKLDVTHYGFACRNYPTLPRAGTTRSDCIRLLARYRSLGHRATFPACKQLHGFAWQESCNNSLLFP
jgi:hypothetical protein